MIRYINLNTALDNTLNECATLTLSKLPSFWDSLDAHTLDLYPQESTLTIREILRSMYKVLQTSSLNIIPREIVLETYTPPWYNRKSRVNASTSGNVVKFNRLKVRSHKQWLETFVHELVHVADYYEKDHYFGHVSNKNYHLHHEMAPALIAKMFIDFVYQ